MITTDKFGKTIEQVRIGKEQLHPTINKTDVLHHTENSTTLLEHRAVILAKIKGELAWANEKSMNLNYCNLN